MKKNFLRMVSVLLALTMSVSMVTIAAVSGENTETEPADSVMEKYQKIDINDITGQGGNPEEISGAASVSAVEKEWYEYIMYSPQPVSSIRIDDNRRFIFYDPYDYGTAMLMKVTGEESEWSSANSISVSYTTGVTMSESSGYSTNSSTSVQVQDGKDYNHSFSKNSSVSNTKSWADTHSETGGLDTKLGTSFEGGGFGLAKVGVSIEATVKSSWTSSTTDTKSFNYSNGNSSTDGWSQVANRVTTSTGSSSSTNTSWSTNSSKTVNRTFNAGYFNSSGAPLQWKIIQYTVYMPMKYELQCKIDGEWVTTDSSYCLLTTMQGTCRAYMQNTQPYVEHWGTGEPVTWDDFWSGFFTEEKLLAAYTTKLYPNN